MKDFILLIPCYNNLQGLISSLKSIDYPISLFRVLIVDDGSHLSVEDIKKQVPGLDIEIIRHEVNKGILAALNSGMVFLKKQTDYKYIARLDCGDTCYPQRFKEQVNYLDLNTEVALLGSWCRFTNKQSGKSYKYLTRTNHEAILKEMYFRCPFIHPTVMFRKEVLDYIPLYPKGYQHAEDYAFFWMVAKRFKSAILPQVLVNVEFSDGNVSSVNRDKQLETRKLIVSEMGVNALYKLMGLAYLILLRLMPQQFINSLKLGWS